MCGMVIGLVETGEEENCAEGERNGEWTALEESWWAEGDRRDGLKFCAFREEELTSNASGIDKLSRDSVVEWRRRRRRGRGRGRGR